jgi:hypothetical protein
MLGVNLGNFWKNLATNMSATGTQAMAIYECRGSVAKICSGIKKRYSNNNDGGGGGGVYVTEYISLQEMKQGQCICPLSSSVHCNFTGDGKCNKRGVGVHPPHSPAQANFTLMTECTPESRR